MRCRAPWLLGEIFGKSWGNLEGILGKSGGNLGGILGESWRNPQWATWRPLSDHLATTICGATCICDAVFLRNICISNQKIPKDFRDWTVMFGTGGVSLWTLLLHLLLCIEAEVINRSKNKSQTKSLCNTVLCLREGFQKKGGKYAVGFEKTILLFWKSIFPVNHSRTPKTWFTLGVECLYHIQPLRQLWK